MDADARTEVASTCYTRAVMMRVEARRVGRLFFLLWVAGGVYVVIGGGDDMPGRENVWKVGREGVVGEAGGSSWVKVCVDVPSEEYSER